MPVVERRKSPIWPIYLAGGCIAVLVLATIAVVSVFLMIRSSMHNAMQSMLNPHPIVRMQPYSFGYSSNSASTKVQLPGGFGTLTYMHCLLDPKSKMPGSGQRAIKLVFSNGSTQQWPLMYSSQVNVKVSVYWYAGANGKGPFVKFYDATGESALDLQRCEIGSIDCSGKRIYMSDYGYNDTEFRTGSHEWSTGKPVKYFSASGKPATDVTLVMTPNNCTCLGTIFRHGNKLVFTPNTKNPSTHRGR
ncbi:MAG: hypothetical protein ABFD54_04855 [Armatimonadota bacterium]|nr:hypothetical protein [bacterium]